MIITYRPPLPIREGRKNCVIVVRTDSLDCICADGRQVKIRNESRGFLRVCTEKDAADTNISVIDPKLTERIESLGKGEPLAYCGRITCVPSAAHSAALSNSTSDVYDAMLLTPVASTARCRVGLWTFESASSTIPRWLETRIATR